MYWFIWFVYFIVGNFFFFKIKRNSDFFIFVIIRYSDKYFFDCCVVFICDVMRIFFSRFEYFDFYFRYKFFVSKYFCGDGFIKLKWLVYFCKFVKYIFVVWYVVFVDFVFRVVEIFEEKFDGCNIVCIFCNFRFYDWWFLFEYYCFVYYSKLWFIRNEDFEIFKCFWYFCFYVFWFGKVINKYDVLCFFGFWFF